MDNSTIENLVENPEEVDPEALIEAYLLACVNFYGIIRVADVLDIITRQNDMALEEADVLKVARESAHAETDFQVCESGFLVAAVFDDWSEDEIEQYHDEIQEVPRYVPPRDTLLNYISEVYFEVPMEADLLQVQIRLHFPEQTPEAPAAVCMVQYLVRQDADLEDIYDALKEEFQIDVRKSDKVFDALTEALIKVNNTTRKWITNGRTPKEALTITGGITSE